MSAFRSRQHNTPTAYDILPPAPARKPQPKARRAQVEIVDAQFETVREGTARRSFDNPPRNDNRRSARHAAAAPAPSKGVSLANLATRLENALMRMSADFFSAVVALVFVVVFGLSGGFSLIGSETADAGQKKAGLDITHASLTPQDANGMQALLINGIIENGDAASRHLPVIRAELVSGGTVLADTLIAPPATSIGAGESRGFSARVPYAGGKRPELRLSFVGEGAPRS